MTSRDYHLVMKQSAQVSQLKARLSEYLRAVRQGGEVVVMDRRTPVARIVPCEDTRAVLGIRPPLEGSPPPGQVPLPPPLPDLPDVLEFLHLDRTPDR
jgi:prevent-host-death family protein